MKDATVEAIRVGWRHLDTARAYENEEVVGEAIREAIHKGYISSRDELFITAKLWNGHMKKKDVEPALNATLRALGVEKVDIYLNHWPWPNVHTPGCAGDHRNPDAVPYIHEAFLETWDESFDWSGFNTRWKIHGIGLEGLFRWLASTPVLALLDLGGIPLRSERRSAVHPLVLAGGRALWSTAPAATADIARIAEELHAMVGKFKV
jgi:hypothetical protein